MATKIGRFRRAIGEEALELLIKSTIETAVEIKAIKLTELERVIVDTTVMEKAIALPGGSRLLEIAATRASAQPSARALHSSKRSPRKARNCGARQGGYAHAFGA
jgi:IS5 family transposase